MQTVAHPSGTAGQTGSQWPRGWYPDPLGRAALRWWDGGWWTAWVSDGQTVESLGLSGTRRVHPADLESLQFVTEVFLPELAARGGLPPEQAPLAARLASEMSQQACGQLPVELPAGLRERIAPATSPPQSPPGTLPIAGGPTGRLSQTVRAPSPWTGPTPTPRAQPRTPSRAAQWWARTRDSVRSDLAVHGLAYLGVLMFFVGAFGLVAFAFGDVQRELRPVAEVAIALVPFGAAALLLRRGAQVVGRALEVVGGLTAPIMIITSLLDGVGIPPDPHGPALVIAASAVCATVAGAYAAWVHRHPASGLRFVVAPMAWLAVAMATMGLGRAIPTNEGVATPGQAQVAATTAALVATVMLARRHPSNVLARPTFTAAVPGIFVLMLLAVLTWTAAPVPLATVLITSALVVLALELLATRIGQAVVGMVAPWWLAFTCSTLGAELGAPLAAAIGAVGFLGLVELAARARRPGWALAIPAAATAALTLPTLEEPWLAVAVLTGLSGWAIARRMRPFPGTVAQHLLDLCAAILPAATVGALALASSAAVATAAAAGAVLAATVPASRPVLHRNPADSFWLRWWQAAISVVGVCAVVLTAAYLTPNSSLASVASPWAVVGASAALALAGALGPLPAALRPWPVMIFGTSSWVLACATIPLPAPVRGGVLAAVALIQVVARQLRPNAPLAAGASAILAGHALGAVAVAWLDWSPTAVAAGLTAATAGWVVTAAGTERGRSPVGTWLAGVWPTLGYLPASIAALALPVTTTAWMWAAAALADSPNPLAAAYVGVAVVLAGLAHLCRRAQVGTPLAVVSILVGIAAAVLATLGWPEALCIAAVVGVIVGLPSRWRPQIAVWLAWAAAAPLGANLAYATSQAFAGWDPGLRSAAALIVVGGLLAVGAAGVERRNGLDRPRALPRRPAVIPAYVVGVAQLVLGCALVLTRDQLVAGWLLVTAGGSVLATAALMRVGGLAAAAVAMSWAGALLALDFTPPTASWPALVLTALLIAGAGWAARHPTRVVVGPEADSRSTAATLSPTPWWARWDFGLLLGCAPVAATALVADAGTATAPATRVAVGVLVLACAGILRRYRRAAVPLLAVAALLVLSGAAEAGWLWLSLALLVSSISLSWAATRTSGWLRALLQVAGAAAGAGAWLALAAGLAWPGQEVVDATAVGAGVVALGGALLLGNPRVGRSWVAAWTGAAAVLLAGATLSGQPITDPVLAGVGPSGAVALGLALASAASFTAAARLSRAWLVDCGTLSAILAILVALQWQAPGLQLAAAILAALAALTAVALLVPAIGAATWRRALIELGVAAAVAAVAAAAVVGDHTVLIAALVAAALQAAAVGSVLRLLWVQTLAAVLACAAWLVFAAQARLGEPQWVSMAIGLTVLVVVGMWRHDRAGRGAALASPEIVAVELVGIALLVGPALVQVVAASVGYSVLALTLGSGITAWGVLTRVRRRMAAGVVTILAALVLLVAVPLVHLLPAWGGAGLWILIAGIGIAAVVIASLLEQGRAVVRTGAARLSETTARWE